jgi:DnaJ-class molecular chaperone
MRRRMRPLSKTSAQRCEDAAELICRCRCGGTLHGAKRGAVGALPFGDPHSLEYECSECKGTGKYKTTWGSERFCRKCKGTGKLKVKEKEITNARLSSNPQTETETI